MNLNLILQIELSRIAGCGTNHDPPCTVLAFVGNAPKGFFDDDANQVSYTNLKTGEIVSVANLVMRPIFAKHLSAIRPECIVICESVGMNSLAVPLAIAIGTIGTRLNIPVFYFETCDY